MDREEYAMVCKMLSQRPPIKATPPGQKFHTGEIVRITNPLSWFSKEYANKKKYLFEVIASHSQQYGGDNIEEYTLRHLWEENESSWYWEDELTLIKSIQEINKERDRMEYEQLKKKNIK
jgi:hypothetical protein